MVFDELGTPWPQHRCAATRHKPTVSRLGDIDLSGTILSHLSSEDADQLSQFIDNNIERDYQIAIQKAAQRSERRTRDSTWITRIDAYRNCPPTIENGVITELIYDANIYRKAGIITGAVGGAVLAKYAKRPLAQITIHTGALAEDENCSFTFFVDQRAVKQQGLSKGCLVSVRLEGVVVKSTHPIWVCVVPIELRD